MTSCGCEVDMGEASQCEVHVVLTCTGQIASFPGSSPAFGRILYCTDVMQKEVGGGGHFLWGGASTAMKLCQLLNWLRWPTAFVTNPLFLSVL